MRHAIVLLAAAALACGNDGAAKATLTFESPVLEDIVPCGSDVVDRWSFEVAAGERVVVLVDTVSDATAADLSFTGTCETSGKSFEGDDEFDCEFPPPRFACPLTQFIAAADETCTVTVRSFSECADRQMAEYVLFVTRDAARALLTLVADDVDDDALDDLGDAG